MVFEEGLDISSLPETLKKDFKPLYQLEGQYRVTMIRMKLVGERKYPLCPLSDVEENLDSMRRIVEEEKPMITLSKVI